MSFIFSPSSTQNDHGVTAEHGAGLGSAYSVDVSLAWTRWIVGCAESHLLVVASHLLLCGAASARKSAASGGGRRQGWHTRRRVHDPGDGSLARVWVAP